MIKVGLFGGNFDPIHLGHLITLQNVKEIRNLDKIVLMPAYLSPFKLDIFSAPSEDRLKMLELAVKGSSAFEISTYEIGKKDVSYTVDTLRHLRQSYYEIELIIGFDNLLSFEKWKDPEEVLRLAKIVVMRRQTDDVVKANKYFNLVEQVNTPIIQISSTLIRERVKNNLPINFLVPKEVNNYISEHKLYL